MKDTRESQPSFLGENASEENARVFIIPVCYERTTTWRRGTGKAPLRILQSSVELDDIDVCTGKDVSPFVHTCTIVKPADIAALTTSLSQIIGSANGLPLVVGGEHSVTVAAAGAFSHLGIKPGSVVVFDAHMDAYADYGGRRDSHANVVYNLVREWHDVPLFLAGVRTWSAAERTFVEAHPQIHVWYSDGPCSWAEAASNSLQLLHPPVFISIDLDVLNPSTLPWVSNPVPGGLDVSQLLAWVRRIFYRFQVCYVDVVEYSPPLEEKTSTDLTVAFILKQIIGSYLSCPNFQNP